MSFERIKSESFVMTDSSLSNEEVVIGRVKHFKCKVIPRQEFGFVRSVVVVVESELQNSFHVKNGWMQPKTNLKHQDEVIVYTGTISAEIATSVNSDPCDYLRFVVVQEVQKIITQPMEDANFKNLKTRCLHSEMLRKKNFLSNKQQTSITKTIPILLLLKTRQPLKEVN
jgi:hypothetical protein